MNTQELAKSFTDMCAKGEFDAAGKKFWSDDVVSREPMTGDMAGLPWANNAMRWAQVAFTEEDPPRYDPNFWFDLFKKTHVEAVCLSAGGDRADGAHRLPEGAIGGKSDALCGSQPITV